MFEQGDGTKLNDSVVEKLAQKFNISLEATSLEDKPIITKAELPGSGYCPNPKCPSNHQYQVEDKVLYKPNRLEQDPVGGKYCAICGEVLERKCPNCGSPVHAGAICSFCGEPYITE